MLIASSFPTDWCQRGSDLDKFIKRIKGNEFSAACCAENFGIIPRPRLFVEENAFLSNKLVRTYASRRRGYGGFCNISYMNEQGS